MSVWRLQLITAGSSIAAYCIQNHVAAMGWSLADIAPKVRQTIKEFEEYRKYADDEYDEKYDSVKRLYYDVKPGDIIWMRSRSEGKYYFARVKPESKWVFNENAVSIDAANQLTDIDWYPASDKADEESVPGAVATAFIMGQTLQKIKKPGVEAYSQMLYNRLHDPKKDSYSYPDPDLSLCESHFYSLLQPEDVEDLLALWLFDTKGYVCIPSTNKIATPKYECVLVDPADTNRKHIYIQVKKGNVPLDAADYAELHGEVYLLTTEGKVSNIGIYNNIYMVNPTEIYQFATNPDKAHIIPENVLYWVKFLTDVENERMKSDTCKGIMLDTNRSYSDTNEYEMLSQSKISAYGDASRYIDSFKKGDYALFYSKGRGIIAIGRITSDKVCTAENEKYHEVNLILPKKFSGNVEELPSLTPTEIRAALNRNFYWASTIKTPFLDNNQVNILISELAKKYKYNAGRLQDYGGFHCGEGLKVLLNDV